MELVDVLEYHFHFNTFRFPLKINRLVDGFLLGVQIPDKTQDPFRLMVDDLLLLLAPQVLEDNGKLRIQISGLVHPAFYFLRPEPGLFENGVVRQKIDLRPGLLGLADLGQKPVLQFHHRYASFIPVVMDIPVPAYLHIHIGRQRVDHRRSHSVETAAGLVDRIIKFSSRMEGGINHSLRGHSFGVQVHRHATSIVGYGSRSVRLQGHMDLAAGSCQVLIHGIVHDLIDQMVQALGGHAADIHARPLAHRLQSFQYCNAVRIICILLRHELSFLSDIFPYWRYLSTKCGVRQTHFTESAQYLVFPPGSPWRFSSPPPCWSGLPPPPAESLASRACCSGSS